MDQLSLVYNATLTGQSYFRNLCCVIPENKLPAVPTDQMPFEKSVKKEQFEKSVR
jgi:hypothetical protein